MLLLKYILYTICIRYQMKKRMINGGENHAAERECDQGFREKISG